MRDLIKGIWLGSIVSSIISVAGMHIIYTTKPSAKVSEPKPEVPTMSENQESNNEEKLKCSSGQYQVGTDNYNECLLNYKSFKGVTYCLEQYPHDLSEGFYKITSLAVRGNTVSSNSFPGALPFPLEYFVHVSYESETNRLRSVSCGISNLLFPDGSGIKQGNEIMISAVDADCDNDVDYLGTTGESGVLLERDFSAPQNSSGSRLFQSLDQELQRHRKDYHVDEIAKELHLPLSE